MIAGRLRWKRPGAPIPGRLGLAAFDFPAGTLLLTEAGTKHRASLYLARGAGALAAHDPGGIDVLAADPAAFRTALTRESHTLRRALADPALSRLLQEDWPRSLEEWEARLPGPA